MGHLHATLVAEAAPARDVRGAVSALAMAILMTVVIAGAVLVAVGARRAMAGRTGAGRDLGTRDGSGTHARHATKDAWAEAGRRMPVPPPEDRP